VCGTQDRNQTGERDEFFRGSGIRRRVQWIPYVSTTLRAERSFSEINRVRIVKVETWNIVMACTRPA
jgi:hypothetical protein